MRFTTNMLQHLEFALSRFNGTKSVSAAINLHLYGFDIVVYVEGPEGVVTLRRSLPSHVYKDMKGVSNKSMGEAWQRMITQFESEWVDYLKTRQR